MTEPTVTIDDACAAVSAAFPEHALDPRAAFHEWGISYTDARAFKEGARGKPWSELPPTFLEWHHEALMFLGPSSLADYLPAYLTAVLRAAPGLSAMPGFLFGVLTRDDPARFEARYAALSPAQRRAVAMALSALETTWQGSHRQDSVRLALDSHWRTLVS